MGKIPHEQAGVWVEALEQTLLENGITIPTGSDFESVWLFVKHREEARAGGTVDQMEDTRADHRKAIGLIHLARLVYRAKSRGCLQPFVNHLRLLPKWRFAQNDRAFFDEGSNKVFELLFGLVCSEAGDGVVMDDPVRSKGKNPDVLVTIDNRRWGFACKVLSGYSGQTVYERLQEGIDQIEKASEAEVGCVVFNLKNVMDYTKRTKGGSNGLLC
ncbi:MAG: hypothetical protein AMK75_00365 [Planctomycetes bacterium SM23_65]|nr:MAG: hypothetical protein AMK75_00365 [Planctomycetes bacterium SM23_65]